MATTNQISNGSQSFSVSENCGATGVLRTGSILASTSASFSLNTITTPSISKIAFKTGTITATNSIELNLTDGSLQDLAGNTGVIFTEIHAICVSITDGNTLTVGGTVTNGNKLWFSDISDSQQIELGGFMFLQGGPTPKAVSGSTNKIKITAGSIDCDYIYAISGN